MSAETRTMKAAIQADQLPEPVEFRATCPDCGVSHVSKTSSARIAASGSAVCLGCLWKRVGA